MAMCKFCGKPFQWGKMDDGWVPLVPIEEHEGLRRTHQDANGVLRADHRLICVNRGGPAVHVVQLAKAIEPEDVLPLPAVMHSEEKLQPKPRRRAGRLGEDTNPEAFTIFKKRKPRKE